MDKARARALLDQERRRLDLLGRAVARDHDDAVAVSSGLEDQVDGAGRRVAEETSQALGERLRDRWGALERAEARLAAGTFGASILSGRPIPDERLEAFPLAELTVQEAAQRDRDLGGGREPESRMGPSRAIPSGCSMIRQPRTMGWSRTRGAMTSRVHRPTWASAHPLRPNAAKAWPSLLCSGGVAVRPSTSRPRAGTEQTASFRMPVQWCEMVGWAVGQRRGPTSGMMPLQHRLYRSRCPTPARSRHQHEPPDRITHRRSHDPHPPPPDSFRRSASRSRATSAVRSATALPYPDVLRQLRSSWAHVSVSAPYRVEYPYHLITANRVV